MTGNGCNSHKKVDGQGLIRKINEQELSRPKIYSRRKSIKVNTVHLKNTWARKIKQKTENTKNGYVIVFVDNKKKNPHKKTKINSCQKEETFKTKAKNAEKKSREISLGK